MKILYNKMVFFEEVETKSGAILKRIVLEKNHFLLEQNPLKESKYGRMYRKIKTKKPDFYMFWEIKDDEFTGKVLVAEICESKDLDEVLENFLKN